MGDPEADTDNEVLKMEQVVQVGLVAFLLVGWIHWVWLLTLLYVTSSSLDEESEEMLQYYQH